LSKDAPKTDIKQRETEAIDARKKANQAHQDQLKHLTVLEDSRADSRAREQALQAFRAQHLPVRRFPPWVCLDRQECTVRSPHRAGPSSLTREAYEQTAVRTARNMVKQQRCPVSGRAAGRGHPMGSALRRVVTDREFGDGKRARDAPITCPSWASL
jgi:hypothetical protein